jgi:hypothetical protein
MATGSEVWKVNEIDAEIRARLAEVRLGSASAEAIVAHLRSLARWHREPQDYVDPGPAVFPASLPIAYAVCHPECGTAEFIVEGSTQECQHCGGLLFRMETREYTLAEQAI